MSAAGLRLYDSVIDNQLLVILTLHGVSYRWIVWIGFIVTPVTGNPSQEEKICLSFLHHVVISFVENVFVRKLGHTVTSCDIYS